MERQPMTTGSTSNGRNLWLFIQAWLLVCAVESAFPTPAPTEPSGEARFTLIYDGAAVKDNRSGLIWEQSPDLEHDAWGPSIARCSTKLVGGRKGWRAPTVDELKSLIDPDQQDPALPPGHPFSNIRSSVFWTATTSPTDDILAWQVSFFTGQPVTDQKSGTRRMWCVLDETRK